MDDTQLWHHRSWGRCNIAKSIAIKLALSGRTYQEFRLSILTKLHAIKLRIYNVIRCDSVLLVRFMCRDVCNMQVICICMNMRAPDNRASMRYEIDGKLVSVL